MRSTLFFLAFALFVAFGFAQTFERYVIDDFTVNQGQNVKVTLPTTIRDQYSNPVVGGSSYYNATCGNELIGCGRDMRIEIFSGDNGREFTSQIFDSTKFTFNGEWDISNPKGGKSISYNQYDGNDSDFTTVNTAGLGGFDFTDNNLVIAIRFYTVADLPSQFTLDLYDTAGRVCEGVTNFNTFNQGEYYSQDQIADDIAFTSMTGNCDLTRGGAAEISIPSTDAVDAIVYQIRGVGFPDPSASATPSQTPAPSPSNTPFPTPAPSQSQTPFPSSTPSASNFPSQSRTPAPSQSNTPAPSPSRTPTPAPSQSRTPTPSTSKQCSVVCNCPIFTCHLVYQFNTSDEKNLFYN